MDEHHRNNKTQSPPKHGEEERSYRRLRDEEYSAEFTADSDVERRNDEVISMYGWIGIVVSLISFFMWPLVFGVAGIILGFVSRSKGASMLGNAAIAVGIISIAVRFFIYPFF